MSIDRSTAVRPALVDAFGRRISYLRVSVTDRCNYRCTYCLGDHPVFVPKREVLSLDELDRLCSAFVRCGVRRLRLTGGEPLTRRNVVGLVESLSRHLADGMLDEITMTTNGALLGRFADALAAAGMRRINVSVDTLDPAVFARVTRGGDLRVVLDGIAAAQAAGMAVKINTVVQAGVNDRAIPDLVRFAHGHGMDLSLIETMPVGAVAADRAGGYVPLDRIRAALAARFTLTDLPDRSGGPARYVRIAEIGGRVGFITPMSHGFCGDCNRVRVTCTGRLVLCLGRSGAADLRAALRASEGDDALVAAIHDAIGQKPQSHSFALDQLGRPAIVRGMNATGG
ncbi:GTP 3',8-cyclase MoaA [Rhodoplanes elegans]|uniref:GTP 3',8-cyclase n=1 Tax=Rhodoplanes elegans TaxID=29408 RepID=A0A327KWN2_9BRAD|nr:GTP 3',8-cyclase MoaA [Rhodoplanes elegans]MBK5960057.1 GTP 3',8-cyclase MoaA [Rhodoplanes elegans]RAI41632.1 GTP 3',8-cyclase MoaA [Rhodoplanes elegans]